MAVPADLRVLCRRLAATPVGDLPGLLPVLVNHVLHCGGPLSAPLEQKTKDGVNESSMLVHKLRTQINTLLAGKTPQGRFVAVILIKSVIDVGGWECLRASESWVRGLLSILQKPDPIASKELCVVTLTKIYTLLHGYQTLVREIATPTVGSFVTACLQLVKPTPPGLSSKVSLQVVETVISALSNLVPLFPTTLRPFSAQIRAAVRNYIAPTSSDRQVVPVSLREACRQLSISLHYTATKNGNADEWQKLVASTISRCHLTADQIFRAVQESWESSSGHVPVDISFEEESHGGSDAADDLPTWSGVSSGGERLAGLLDLLADCFRVPSKTPVAIPLSTLSDLVTRLSLILPPGPQDRDLLMPLNPSASREERDELWSTLPSIHQAALQLLIAMVRRLKSHVLPQASEFLEETLRIFKASRSSPEIRSHSFVLIRELLLLSGPTLSKVAVDSLEIVIHSCCHDILGAAGHLESEKPQSKPAQNGKASATANADLFLLSKNGTATSTTLISLAASHQQAAEALLEALLSHLPQQHLKKAERALLDRTAILSGTKAALVASVLHPYMDKSGKFFANTVPFLAQRYPHDADVEILRSNIRSKPYYFGDVLGLGGEGSSDGPTDEDTVESTGVTRNTVPVWGADESDVRAAGGFGSGFGAIADSGDMEDVQAIRKPGLEEQSEPIAEPMTLKRKSVELDVEPSAPKRVDTGKAPEISSAQAGQKEDAGEDSDSDGSVHLDMVLDDEDEDDED